MISDKQQLDILKSLTYQQVKGEAMIDSDECSDYLSANESDENKMRLDSSPFKPIVPKKTEVESKDEESREADLNQSVNLQLQQRLDKQILVMKAQHQFIQNLQRANLTLKSKIKQLEEVTANREVEISATQGDLVDDTVFQEMELVPVGPIEKINRRERDFEAARDKENYPSNSRHSRPRPENFHHKREQSGGNDKHQRSSEKGSRKQQNQVRQAVEEPDLKFQWDKNDVPKVPQGFWEELVDQNKGFASGQNLPEFRNRDIAQSFKNGPVQGSNEARGAGRGQRRGDAQRNEDRPRFADKIDDQDDHKTPQYVDAGFSGGRGRNEGFSGGRGGNEGFIGGRGGYENRSARGRGDRGGRGGFQNQERPKFDSAHQSSFLNREFQRNDARPSRGRGNNFRGGQGANILKPIDCRDEQVVEDTRQDLRPNAFFNNVAERSRDFEQSRRGGRGRGQAPAQRSDGHQDRDQRKEPRPYHTTNEDGFEIKTYQEGEFMIQAKDQFAGRHFFVEEELVDSSPDPSPAKQANGSPCKVYEVGKEDQYSFPMHMREVEAKEVNITQTLLEDFGFSNKHASGLTSLDQSEVRARLLKAINGYDEELLSQAIDDARMLGKDCQWPKDIEKAEHQLFELTCGGAEDPFCMQANDSSHSEGI